MTAYKQGYYAGRSTFNVTVINPYTVGTSDYNQWEAGYFEGVKAYSWKS